MTILVIAEHDNQKIKASTDAVIYAGLQLAESVDVLLLGYQCKTLAENLATTKGIKQVLYADDIIYQHPQAENMAAFVMTVANQYSHILAPANTFGKNFLPRVAAKLDVEQIGDVLEIIDQNTFVRPIYAGNALIKVQSSDPIKLLTIRVTAFMTHLVKQEPATIIKLQAVIPSVSINYIRLEQHVSTRPELSTARIVIAGGRGLQSAQNFHLLETIAEKLNAAVGATRAAVDAGFVPNDYQIGQTGKVVAPELYIAVGISGAIQHIAGMKGSKVIVAINKDPDAPIFQIADYGLVGDLFRILPALEKLLEKKESLKK